MASYDWRPTRLPKEGHSSNVGQSCSRKSMPTQHVLASGILLMYSGVQFQALKGGDSLGCTATDDANVYCSPRIFNAHCAHVSFEGACLHCLRLYPCRSNDYAISVGRLAGAFVLFEYQLA